MKPKSTNAEKYDDLFLQVTKNCSQLFFLLLKNGGRHRRRLVAGKRQTLCCFIARKKRTMDRENAYEESYKRQIIVKTFALIQSNAD